MSKDQQLRDKLKRLTADEEEEEEIFELLEGLISDYEEEINRLKEEIKGWKVLEAVFKPQVHLKKADLQPLLVTKGKTLPHSDDIIEAEPVASSSSEHRTPTAQDDGEDDGGPQAASNSGPNSQLQPDTSGRRSDSSGTETEDRDNRKQSRELWSNFNCEKSINIVSPSYCNIAEEPTYCSEFVIAYGQMCILEQLKEMQASGKPLSCSDQSNKQKQKGTLNKNGEIHTGQREIACDGFGRRFGQKSNMHKHMTIHTGEKKFGCSECGGRFARKPTLDRHMITHTGEKKFVCSECGRRFGRKRTLNDHMVVHTGEKLFVCCECGHRFGQSRKLKQHMKIHFRPNKN